MSAAWVAATLREMLASSDAPTRELARQLIRSAQRPPGERPHFKGIVVEAMPNPKPPPVYIPDDVTPADRGKNGYDFTEVELPNPDLIQ
jgi:hypothetical protein